MITNLIHDSYKENSITTLTILGKKDIYLKNERQYGTTLVRHFQMMAATIFVLHKETLIALNSSP